MEYHTSQSLHKPSREALSFIKLYSGNIVSRNVLILGISSPFVIVLTLWSLLLGPGAVPTDTTLSNRHHLHIIIITIASSSSQPQPATTTNIITAPRGAFGGAATTKGGFGFDIDHKGPFGSQIRARVRFGFHIAIRVRLAVVITSGGFGSDACHPRLQFVLLYRTKGALGFLI
ncbi:hypothetical protein Tco_0743178 [Tanacetum coccineum]